GFLRKPGFVIRDPWFAIAHHGRILHAGINGFPGGDALLRVPDPESRISVPERLAGLEHVADAGLGLFLLRQFDEVLALPAQPPLLVDQAAAVDFAAADHGRDAGRDLVVVRADEAAFQHADQQHAEGGDADVAGDLDAALRQRRTVAAL